MLGTRGRYVWETWTQIEHVLADPVFRKNVDGLLQTKRQEVEAPAWFQQNHSQGSLTCVAYFSVEFMLSEALPIYSGGLGNVAGDQLKANSDLGVPVVGVGLLYQQGYFRQVIDKDGAQQALFSYNDPGQLPITPLRQANGEWLRLEIALPGYSVWLRAWQVQVGRVKLYLLDSNDAANFPAHRGITSELYGGGPELRLKQELLLGIGGWRLLAALGIQPEVCHLNEGHAAFAVLERARSFMQETAHPFEVALAATRAGNLFTTHTAVAAGFDPFAPARNLSYLIPGSKASLILSSWGFDCFLWKGKFSTRELEQGDCHQVTSINKPEGSCQRQMKQDATLIRGRSKTPRAAAIAGILFSVLLITGLLLFRLSVRADPLKTGA